MYKPVGFVLVSFLSPFFRHAWRCVVVAVVIIGCRRSVARGFLCGCRLALSCLLRVSRSGFPSVPPSCLLAIRSGFVPSCRRIVQLPVCSTSGTGRIAVAYVRVYMVSQNVICLSFLLYISHSCYISGVLVIYLAFLLYAWRFCYISRILVISTCFMLYYFVEVMRLWAGVFN